MLVAASDLSVSTRLLTICFIMQILWPKWDSNPKIQGYTEGLNFGKTEIYHLYDAFPVYQNVGRLD